jgi:hypothetical protein
VGDPLQVPNREAHRPSEVLVHSGSSKARTSGEIGSR